MLSVLDANSLSVLSPLNHRNGRLVVRPVIHDQSRETLLSLASISSSSHAAAPSSAS